MRTALVSFLVVVVGLALAGCTCSEAALAPAAPVAAAPCYAPAASPCAAPAYSVAAPQLVMAQPQLVMAQPTGVEMRVGAAEHARAALAIPGGLVVCGSQWLAEVGAATGRALQCAGGALIPTPTPSLRYTYAPTAPAAAAPCAPAYAPPAGYVLVPAAPVAAPARAPCPEPVAISDLPPHAQACIGDACVVVASAR